MKTAFKILVLLIIIFTIASCNLFMSSPRMRSNKNDFYTQLTAFTAVPVSKNSIVTMWNWKSAQNWIDSDERIEKINIVHSTLGYPDLLNIPFVGETFSDSTKWQFTWKDLAPNTTHYFSLFMQDADGSWHPPLHAKAKLPGVIKTMPISLDNAWKVGSSPSVSTPITSEAANNAGVIILEFDVPPSMKIVSAVINPDGAKGLKTSSLLSFNIYPLIQPFNESDAQEAWDETGISPAEGRIVDKVSGVELAGTNNSFNTVPLDITIPVQRAVLTGSYQLVIQINTNTIFNFPYPDFIILKYVE